MTYPKTEHPVISKLESFSRQLTDFINTTQKWRVGNLGSRGLSLAIKEFVKDPDADLEKFKERFRKEFHDSIDFYDESLGVEEEDCEFALDDFFAFMADCTDPYHDFISDWLHGKKWTEWR